MRTLQHVNLTFLYQKFISLENILFGTLPVSTQCSKKKKIKTLKKKSEVFPMVTHSQVYPLQLTRAVTAFYSTVK